MISNRMTFVWDRCNQASGTEGMGTKPINLPSLELVGKSFPATTYTSKIFPSAIVATLTCSTVHQATDSELDSNVDQMSSSTSSLDYDSSDDDSSDDEESKIKASNSDESVNKPYGQHLVSVNYWACVIWTIDILNLVSCSLWTWRMLMWISLTRKKVW